MRSTGLKKRRAARMRASNARRCVLPSETFARVIEYERARADRSGQVLSLVCFQARESDNRELLMSRLVDFFCRRLRAIDEVGWMPDGRLAIALPYTPVDGAWCVADEAVLTIPTEIDPPHCEVLSYPHDGQREISSQTSDVNEARRSEYLGSTIAVPVPFWKRLLDVLLAAAGLLILSPLLVLVAVAIKITSPGPVLFRQVRIGHRGQPFRILKFRTMVNGAESKRNELAHLNEQDGPAFKIKNDPRVTALGRLLRKTSIDELPQLWNILVGDMSLVGPRPLPLGEAQSCLPWQFRRHDVTPGLTCLWQVKGRSSVCFDDWMRMDLHYIRHRSFLYDLALLIATVPAVILRRGAH